jgi:L-fucose mutarotase
MEVVGDPNAIPPVQREVQQVLDRAAGKHVPLQGIERFDFYERARNAFVILITGERRFYGDFIFKKGVVPPE